MPQIILHIGTHKTATTSIQQFLRHHDATLAERGVFYPNYTLIGKGSHYAHLGMVNALSGRHKSYSTDTARKFFAKVRERAADFDTTIISAEPFYRHVDNKPGDSPYYTQEEYWPLRQAYIDKVQDIFGDAQVVVVFRRQMDYAQSLYQEHVKVTSYRRDFRKFLSEFWFHFAFAEQAEAWASHFASLQVLNFEKLQQTGDAVGEFCRLLSLPIEGLERLPRSNEGMPVDLVTMKRTLHRVSEDRDALRAKLERLANLLPDELEPFFKTRSFFTAAREARTFQKSFTAANERLRPFLVQPHDADRPIFSVIPPRDQVYGDRIMPQVLDALLDLSLNPDS